MNAAAPTAGAATPRLAPGGTDQCRITVAGPERRVDLAIPASATVGELLPVMVRHAAGPDAADQAWVLQRLGGAVLDFGATAESLDLREGEVLYLSPQSTPLPEFDFDDVSVGVAHAVTARADRWRPAFSAVLLLVVSALAAAAFAIGVAGVHTVSTRITLYALACVLLAAGAAVRTRRGADRIGGTLVGLGACWFAALAGFAARHGAHGLFTVDRQALMITGCTVAAVAIGVAVAGRLPTAAFGAVAATGVCAAGGAALATAFAASATAVAAILAVVLFAATTVNLRIALRVARLRVALLPRTAEELQEDIDPVPEALVTKQTGRAVAHLDALFITCSLVYGTAFAQLVRQPGWAGATLAGVLGVAVLLRARGLNLAWQRVPLAVSGAAGLALVALKVVSGLGPSGRTPGLLVLLLCAVALLAASGELPGRRLLPVWGQLADNLELLTSLALLPLLLQVFHVYAHFRALIK
ncbi:type VII secretion integral membrane protein EccD [Catenulispora sp. GP43]|uniref:type VII secretion integral membrane protein EccD n=1 Tax=Catenulispora sp. GP43 TaxID=3156263 RepID=UPI003517A242